MVQQQQCTHGCCERLHGDPVNCRPLAFLLERLYHSRMTDAGRSQVHDLRCGSVCLFVGNLSPQTDAESGGAVVVLHQHKPSQFTLNQNFLVQNSFKVFQNNKPWSNPFV
jgi:hypothetical protein